ncbi:MAG: 50S ribosomal protein L5 [Simkaniaceae bacterium]|nr:50S ribosomal protein L5 [Simkaniaceae bacterium]
MSRLKKKYQEEVKLSLQKQFNYKNVMQIPHLEKIVISMGIKEAVKDKNLIQDAIKELTDLSGQKPIVCNSKKDVANFKLRAGVPIGLKVTLRGKRMYDFMDRFCNIVAPRISDFRGFNPKCDGKGNYSLGLTNQQVFPEVKIEEVKREQGMHITFVTTAASDEQCFFLLKEMGLPFKKQGVPHVA